MMMMKRTVLLTAATVVTAMASATHVAADQVEMHNQNKDQENHNRQLQAFDFFDIDIDLCDNRPDGVDGVPNLGRCDLSRFPSCEDGRNQICYNRKPSRDEFVPATHQPVYFIQYDRVFCYPNSFGGCSSCTPGRYCASEDRCILEENGYPCERWF